MTMICFVEKQCCICGAKINTSKINSITNTGLGELDFRSVCLLQDVVLESELEECYECGYIAPDITTKESEYKSFMKDPICSFLHCKAFMEIDNIAFRFIKYAIFNDWRKNYEECYKHFLNAARRFDDLKDAEAAHACRLRGITALENIERKDECILLLKKADLYRRTRQFEKINFLKEIDFDEFENVIANYQLHLAMQKDDRIHYIEEAFMNKKNGRYNDEK